MSNRTLNLTDPVYDYLQQHSLREPPLLAKLREETGRHRLRQMQIAPEQGQFMALLVRLLCARRCLEVGVFTGYSSLCVALAMPEDGRLMALDVSEEFTEVARHYWREAGVEDRIELRIAPALESLDALVEAGDAGTWDFVFIDADKTSYLHYYERALTLLRPGGLVAVDNVLWNGLVADHGDDSEDTEAIRAFNEHVHADERVDISLVPIGDGLTLARKR